MRLGHVGGRTRAADRDLVDNLRVGPIGDVEQRELNRVGERATPFRLLGRTPDADQVRVVERMQIAAEAGHLQLTHDLRIVRIGQIHHVERIHLLERDEKAVIADEARRVDALAGRDVVDLPADDEAVGVLG